jgi:hypothetical protein
MIVILDETLEVNERVLEPKSLEYAKASVIGALTTKAKEKGYKGPVDVTLEDASISGETMFHTLGFVGMLSKAYSAHLPVVIAPHDFWFIANTELAAMVARSPDQFRHVFTSQESGKETLMIPTGNVTRIDYRALTELLDQKIPNKRIHELMIPGLTTIDASVFHALCATLADTCQHYYDYMTMLCGIPKIKVRGEESDYRLLAAASRELAGILSFSTEAVEYYDRIAGLFDRMADTFVRGPEESADFWLAIYTQKNVGSGRQLDIDGWIRDFFSKRPRRLESFHTSIAVVPYKNMETQNEYLSLVGAFTAFQDSEGFWRLNFQEAIFQKVAEKDAPPEVTSESWTPTERTIHYSDGSKKVIPIPQKSPQEKAAELAAIDKAMAGWTLQELPPVVAVNPNAAVKKIEESANVEMPKGHFRQPGVMLIEDDLNAAFAYAATALMKEEDEKK